MKRFPKNSQNAIVGGSQVQRQKSKGHTLADKAGARTDFNYVPGHF